MVRQYRPGQTARLLQQSVEFRFVRLGLKAARRQQGDVRGSYPTSPRAFQHRPTKHRGAGSGSGPASWRPEREDGWSFLRELSGSERSRGWLSPPAHEGTRSKGQSPKPRVVPLLPVLWCFNAEAGPVAECTGLAMCFQGPARYDWGHQAARHAKRSHGLELGMSEVPTVSKRRLSITWRWHRSRRLWEILGELARRRLGPPFKVPPAIPRSIRALTRCVRQ